MPLVSQKKSFLKNFWNGMNSFFESIFNFFKKTFSSVYEFCKSSPILFALSAVFLFFLEGCIYCARGMIVESFFMKIYSNSSKTYRALKLDKLMDFIKEKKYNFCGPETKLKIQVEIFSFQIIENLFEKQIEEEGGFYIFDYGDDFNNQLKETIIDNFNHIFNDKNIDKNNLYELSTKKILEIFIEFNQNLEVINEKNGEKIKGIINENEKKIIKAADKNLLKEEIIGKGFNHGKIREELSNLILNRIKNSTEYKNKENKESFILGAIERINAKTKYTNLS
jgi:hypothetical protein